MKFSPEIPAPLLPAAQHVATAALRLHWILSGRAVIGRGYKKVTEAWQQTEERVRFAAWQARQAGPQLDHAAADALLTRYRNICGGRAETANSQIAGRLLAHVAFHFKGSRVKFARETVDGLKRLPFEDVRIVVDTNTHATADFIATDERTTLSIHDDLAHPFDLTWVHRTPLRQALPAFDYFMYIEDDILIPPSTAQAWAASLEIVKPAGYLPGFLRVETDRRGRLVSSDFLRPSSRRDVIEIAGRPFLKAAYPYTAFWLYDRATMERFVDSPVYTEGFTESDIRASAATGFSYRKVGSRYEAQVVLPLTDKLCIDPACYVFHMPANYGRLLVPHPAGLGTLPVESLVAG